MKIMLHKLAKRKFFLTGFFVLLFVSAWVFSDPRAPSGSSTAWAAPIDTSNLSISSLIESWRAYVSNPIAVTQTPPTPRGTSGSSTSLLSTLRTLLDRQDIRDQLRGPQGIQGLPGLQGEQGPQGPAGSGGSGGAYFAPLAPPPSLPPDYNSGQIVGNSGGYASLGVQDLLADTLTVSGTATFSGGIAGTITGTVNPSFTLGSVAFQGATSLAEDNANFFWDDTNNRLGVGTAAPSELLSLGLAGTTKGVLSLAGDTSGKIIIQPASAAGTYTLTLPTSDGTASQFLQTDGAGVLTWSTPAGSGDVIKVGTPVNNQVGVWTGDGTIEGTSGLTYDGSNLLLTGDIGITGTRITKGWFTDLEVTNAIAGSITGNAATVTTNANLTGIVTSTGNATAIADKAIAIAKLADGTDGELITWDASGVVTTVAVGTSGQVLTSNGAGAAPTFQAAAGGGANTALSNLASVAINTTLVSDTYNTDALGTSAIGWSDLFLGTGSVIDWSSAASTSDVTLTHSSDTLTFAGGTIALGTATATGGLTGDVTGNVSGTAATVTGAAQTAITSLGTLTALTVDNVVINGNDISSSSGNLTITPVGGSNITFDGTITLDAGVIAGATSITSTTFVGALTGNADTATAMAWSGLTDPSGALSLSHGTNTTTMTTSATTGNFWVTDANALTTGTAFRIPHTTSVIAAGGSLARISSTSVDTSTTTGTLLDLSATATVTGRLASIASSAASQTATRALDVTQSGATITAYTGNLVNFTGGFSGASSTGNVLSLTSVNTSAGSGLNITANALTTGTAFRIPHTTSVIAAGGSLARISSTSVDTSTTTGTLLDLSSTASLAGTQFLQTYSGLTTGIGSRIVANALTSGILLDLSTNGTGALTNQKGLNIALAGANGTGGQTTYGAYLSNTHSGTSTNVGLYTTATGGSNNYAAIFENGNVGIGDTSPVALLTVGSGDLFQVNSSGAITAGSITSGFTSIDVGAGAITTTGDITGGGILVTGDTAAGDSAALGYTATEGLILTGQGSTNDITIKNDADADVITVATGTTTVTLPGILSVDDTTDSTSTTTGSIHTDGGLGVAKDLFAGATVNVATEILFTERADHNFTPVATRGILWVKNDAANTLYYTDDAGVDHNLIAAESGDITDVFNCASGDCGPSLALADGDLLDMSLVSVTSTTEGLILPQHATDCSSVGTAEGQVCWEADADALYIGNGSTVTQIGAGGAFDSTTVDATTWSDGANASNVWTFDVSGTDTTATFGNNNWIIGAGSVDLGAAGVRLTQDGDGSLTFLGLGNGSDEDLTLDLDNTANIAEFTTSTGVTNILLTSIGLESRGAAGAGGSLDITTAELTVVDGDILGQIDFQAPLESDGTDAILVGASIWAEADDTFSATVNDTDLVFATAVSETATEKARLTSTGLFEIDTLRTGPMSFEDDAGIVSWVDMDITAAASDNDVYSYSAQIDSTAILTIYGISTSDALANPRVGIGTTVPQSILDVQGAAGAAGILTLATKELTVVDGDKLGRIDFNAPLESAGTDAILVGASIWAEADATFSATVNTTDLVFATGDSEAATEKMRLDSLGQLHIGGTAADSILLDVEDDIEVGTGTTGCVRDADNTTLTGTCVSDERLKTNIVSFPSILDTLLQLRPVTFEWRNDEYDWLNGQAGTNYGLIAQEVETLFPEMVQTDDKGYKRVAYDVAFSVRLLQGIKELDLKLESTTLELPEPGSFASRFFDNLFTKITTWLADAGNGIGDFFVNRVRTRELCVSDGSGETCITRTQLETLLKNSGGSNNNPPPPPPTTDETEQEEPIAEEDATEESEQINDDEPPPPTTDETEQEEPIAEEEQSTEPVTESDEPDPPSESEEAESEPATEPTTPDDAVGTSASTSVGAEPTPEPAPTPESELN